MGERDHQSDVRRGPDSPDRCFHDMTRWGRRLHDQEPFGLGVLPYQGTELPRLSVREIITCWHCHQQPDQSSLHRPGYPEDSDMASSCHRTRSPGVFLQQSYHEVGKLIVEKPPSLRVHKAYVVHPFYSFPLSPHHHKQDHRPAKLSLDHSSLSSVLPSEYPSSALTLTPLTGSPLDFGRPPTPKLNRGLSSYRRVGSYCRFAVPGRQVRYYSGHPRIPRPALLGCSCPWCFLRRQRPYPLAD